MNALNSEHNPGQALGLAPGRLVRIHGCGLTGRVLGREEDAAIGRYAVLVPVLGQSVTLPAGRLIPLSAQAGERLGRRAQRINRDAQAYLEQIGRADHQQETPRSLAPLTLSADSNATDNRAQLANLAELIVSADLA